jgi:diguanylate cyclase (GGDEF)-like protein
MQKRKISVCSDRAKLVDELRERCTHFEFEACDPASSTTVLVIDAEKLAARGDDTGKDLTRIVLGDTVDGNRVFGEIRLSEKAFMEMPEEWISVAADLADVQEERRQLEESAGLDMRVRELLMLKDLESVFERVGSDLAAHFGVEGGWLFIHEPSREIFALVHGDEDPIGTNLPTDIEKALHQTHDEELPHVLLDGRLAIPVFVDEDLIGAFVCPMGSAPATAVLGEALKYLDAVTAVLSNARQVSENRDLALRDDLTKAFNRRFFESYLDEEIERTRRYGSVFSIIFLDLDDLKTINNKHGHLVGSRVLQEVAKRILLAVRTIDKVVRFGGDEFCIILPETDKDQATSVAMRVRKSMSHSPFRIEPDIDVPITASFGIASYPNHALTKEGLIRQADEAMYRVKSTTKNSIGVAGDFEPNQTETAAS